ncbi:hypothetical protein ACWCOX_23800, partial [Micromonospora parva]
GCAVVNMARPASPPTDPAPDPDPPRATAPRLASSLDRLGFQETALSTGSGQPDFQEPELIKDRMTTAHALNVHLCRLWSFCVAQAITLLREFSPHIS